MNDALRILPEIILTVTGVLVMIADALLPKPSSRKSLGWLAVLGTLAALAASFWQYQLPAGTAYYGVVQTDAFSVFFHVLIAGIVLASLLITLDAVTPETEGLGELFALMLFGAVGMMLMTSAVELLLVFVALEISSISTYIMAGFRRKSGKSPESALKYFLLGSFATSFFLYGIALVFGATGTTRIAAIAAAVATANPLLRASLRRPRDDHRRPRLQGLRRALPCLDARRLRRRAVAGRRAHVHRDPRPQPSPFCCASPTAPSRNCTRDWVPILWWLAVISMTIGNLGALRQRNVKRMLAYSSIAHAGYLLVAFTALSADGIAAASFYAVSYAAMNVGVFAVVSHAGGYDDHLTLIDDYRGLAYRSPLLGGAMAFFLISLIGIPFTGGFFGKFYVFSAALHSGMVWLTIIGLINSGVAAFYYLRVVIALYSRPSEATAEQAFARPSIALLIAIFITSAATLILGIVPGNVLDAARAAAQTFTSVGQDAAPSTSVDAVSTGR